MPSYINVPEAIKQAKLVIAKKETVLEELGVVRTDLRNAVRMGGVSPEDKKWIEETFPVHKRTRTK